MVRVSCLLVFGAWLLSSGVWLAGSTALAQASAEQEGAHSGDDRERALELYRQSREHYDTGAYREAARLLEQAYDLHPEPSLLYNLARAYGSLGEHALAIESYEAYLEAAPATDDRAMIEARIANSRRILEQEQERERQRREAAEARQRASVERARRDARRSEPGAAPWIVAGSGALVLGVGVVFGGLSLRARNEAEDEPAAVAAAELSDRAVVRGWVANASFIVGGLLALIGTVWGLVSAKKADDGGGPVVRLDPAGMEIAW